MGQQQIQVSFSLGTKLLISVVTLLFLVILFLNISTIFLFREDKRAYTFQTQSTEAVLAGRQFTALAKQSLGTLRTLLGAVDFNHAGAISTNQTVQSILDNQSELLGVHFLRILDQNNEDSIPKTIGTIVRKQEIESLKLKLEDYRISQDWMKALLPDLKKSAYGFLNLSKVGQVPMLGVLFADLALKDSPEGMPIAVGLVPLKAFGADLQSLRVTVATRTGWILYDTDSASIYSNENIAKNPLFGAALASKLETGAMDYEYEGIRFLGSYLNPGFELIVLSKTEWRKAMQPTYAIIEKCLLLGLMAVGAAIVFAILFSKTLTAPLARIYEATKQVAAGDFSLFLSEGGNDELTALAKSFNLMSGKISALIQDSIKRVQLENEMAIASTVQQTLIPPSEFKNDWIEIYSHYRPAEQCGGDWWGFFGVGNRVAIMIADATGHGLPCALMTASARSCFSVMHKWAQEDPEFTFSPSAMLSFANRVIFDASQGAIMMTFFIAVIDRDAKKITYSNAGHNSPWLFKKDAEGNFSPVSLTVPGERVGETKENDHFEEASVEISESDILFLYTDGLTEGKNLEGNMYGKMTARKFISKNIQLGPSMLITRLMEDFDRHNTGKSLDDDVTIAALSLIGGT